MKELFEKTIDTLFLVKGSIFFINAKDAKDAKDAKEAVKRHFAPLAPLAPLAL